MSFVLCNTLCMCVLCPSGVCAPVTKKSRCVISKISVRDLKNLGAWFGRLTHRDFFVRAATLTVASCKPPFLSFHVRKIRSPKGCVKPWKLSPSTSFVGQNGDKEEKKQKKKFPPLPLYKKKKKKKEGDGECARVCTHEVLALCAIYIPPLFFIFLIFFEEKGIFSVRNPKVVV